MWTAVRQRFAQFVADLQITPDQFDDGLTKYINVGRSLERAYYGGNKDDYPPSLMVGSWGKQTQIRPPTDLDAFFIMPTDVKARFDARIGNVQSALLQEVKEALRQTYPQTTMRGDGQVVVISFNTLTVEVVPVFLAGNSRFIMPDTNEGGRWKAVDPLAQINLIASTDQAMNGNVRALSKIIKHWRNEKDVPLKSFIIELLVAQFLPARGNGFCDTYWYDWYVRDFFIYLIERANTYVTIPGTGELYFLGDAWLPRAITARDSALQACHWEYYDYDVTAGQEWQKIFGTRIPIKI